MSSTLLLDAFVVRLDEAGCGTEPGGTPDFRAAHAIFSELLDMIEALNGAAEYAHFLTQMVPVFLAVLDRVPVLFDAALPEHRLRNIVLEIIHRLIMNDTFAPFAEGILKKLQLLMVEENEDNGVLCMKIITLLHKAYRDLKPHLQGFFEVICRIYDNTPDTIKTAFDEPAKSPATEDDDEMTLDVPKPPLSKALWSFKTLAELPITMVLLYLSYKDLPLILQTLPVFLPKILELLLREVPAQKAYRQGGGTLAVAPLIANAAAFADLVLAQVKAALFLAYVFIRDYIKHVQNPQWKAQLALTVPEVVVRLLQDCPPQLSVARKELLHATKHILLTLFRSHFIPKLDTLFDERILIGDGLTLYETLRPLAYLIVADFIHNVRDELLPAQIRATVAIYCRLLQDDLLALTVQIMLAKLLLNLVEKIMVLPNKVEGRLLFMIIIDAYAKRFDNLSRKYGYIIDKHAEYEQKRKVRRAELKRAIARYLLLRAPDPLEREDQAAADAKEAEDEARAAKDAAAAVVAAVEHPNPDPPGTPVDGNKAPLPTSQVAVVDGDEVQRYILLFNIEQMLPIGHHATSTGILGALLNLDLLKDVHYFYRNLMRFLKLVIFGLKHCNPVLPEAAPTGKDMAKLINCEEINIFRRLFRGGIACLRFFAHARPPAKDKVDFAAGGPNLPITSSKEEKDLMEIFATIFIHIDPALFNEIVNAELAFLFELMLTNAALLHLPQFFLALEVTLANFLLILIKFLVAHLPDLGLAHAGESHILVRLFKLCFMLVNLFPATNEAVLLPHLQQLILRLLLLATTADEPIIYLYLIRILFRLILGGRFEQLYKEIMPILPVILELLNKMIANLRRGYERDIYVELCLTVPVRLLVLVPHLRYLTRPLVDALNGPPDLVNQGLRTFELCVDNLTAEYFDPMIEPVIDEIMAALWKHLEPVPYHHQHSHTAIRILGKLGGRNHKHFKAVQLLHYEDADHAAVQAQFSVHGLGEVPMLVTPGVALALKLYEDPRAKAHYRALAYRYLVAILKLFVDTTPVPDDYADQLAQWVATLDEPPVEPLPATACADPAKLALDQQLFAQLLQVLFSLLLMPEVADELRALVDGLTTHFTLQYVHTLVVERIKKERPFLVADQEGRAYISDTTFLDGLTYALSHWDKAVRLAGLAAVRKMWATAATVFGLAAAAVKFPLWRTMFYRFTHCCYDEHYYTKLGGVLGLECMMEQLAIPKDWFFARQFELVRLIFFVLRDTPDTAPAEVAELAERLALVTLRECNRGLDEAAVTAKPFQTIVGALVYDLALANPAVRRVAQHGLEAIAATTGVAMTTFIAPCKQLLLTPIFGKPLRALPFPMQIGNIDAITFCLQLPDTFVTFGDELNRLLLEALALVDAEDELLANVHRLYEHRTAQQLIELRVVCIRLLLLALTRPDFTLGLLPEARIRILGVFFKALCNKLTEIINAAHQGLKLLLQENAKLPKELLQKGLRPMLMNLLDHKKLTVLGLEALARLLELLILYFRVEIGRKLLDHLMAWAQINTLRGLAGQDLENNDTVQIVMAILNIFHLLPPKAYTFMVEIINTLQYLEGHLDRHQYLPFRVPVAKFLNRFADKTMEYYRQHFNNRKLGHMLAQIAGMPECAGLRTAARAQLAGVVDDLAQETNDDTRAVKFANTVDLVAALADSQGWFVQQRPLLGQLLAMVAPMHRIQKAAPLVSQVHFQLDQGIATLYRVVVQYLEQCPGDVALVIDAADAVCSLELPVPAVLEDFVWNRVVCEPLVHLRLGYLHGVLDYVAANDAVRTKIFLFKHVVNAVLVYDKARYGLLKHLVGVESDFAEEAEYRKREDGKEKGEKEGKEVKDEDEEMEEKDESKANGSMESNEDEAEKESKEKDEKEEKSSKDEKDSKDSESKDSDSKDSDSKDESDSKDSKDKTAVSSAASPPPPHLLPGLPQQLWVSKVHETIWQANKDIIHNRLAGFLDNYRYVLLELTAILLDGAPDHLEEVRKDIIKFAWNYLKLDDHITKQVAYVTTALFILKFDTPTPLVTQVFMALLKTHQSECRHLVRQALDLLAPVMAARPAGLWLRWPRRVISEDGFNVTNVLNVYQFIVHHPDLFFPAREHFIGNMITAMGKLTIQVNPAIENQVLAIELSELILKWENKANEVKKEGKEGDNKGKEVKDGVKEGDEDEAMDGKDDDKADENDDAMDVDDDTKKDDVTKEDDNTNDVTSANDSTSTDDFGTSPGYSVPFGQREACVTFLIRYVCILPQRASELELGQKALGILYELLLPAHWLLVLVKLTFFEKFLLLNDLNLALVLGYCLNALEVLGVVLEWKLAEWIVANLAYLHRLVEKCVRSDNHDIQEVLQRVLRLMLAAVAGADDDDAVKEFVALLLATVAEDLGEMTLTAAGVTLAWTLANWRPATLDPLMLLVMKTFSKLCKDHIAITHQGALPQPAPPLELEARMTTKLLEKVLNLLAMRISLLGDQRRTFLVLLGQLIERLLDKDTLEKIIRIVKGWVFDRTDLFPTTKEKAVILGKMMVFEIRGEPALLKEFYQIIVDIFEDDLFLCSELTVRMEQPFLVGTRLADVGIRRKLMLILTSLLEVDIAKRLYYVVRQQNWEYLADYPWLNQALQLLLGLFDPEYPLRLVELEPRLAPLTAFPYRAGNGNNGNDGNDGNNENDGMEVDLEASPELARLLADHNAFLALLDVDAGQLIEPLVDTFYQLPACVAAAWSQLFPLAFSAIPRGEHLDFTRAMVVLLSKDYHTRQVDSRPNVVQMLLDGALRCGLELPPLAVECLGANFDAWTQAIALLEATEERTAQAATADVREVTQDALAKLYALLREDDMFYGLWRRRAKYAETLSALLFEQIGMWDRALQLYENAQIKARSGTLPYLELEYALWEDHWILCAEKLQHWDILTDLARHEGFLDLLLECGWRVADWNNDRDTLEQTVKNVMDVPTPRRQVFETFLCLQGFAQEKYTIPELTKHCDEGIQLALRKWHGLPARFNNAHVPLLHTFQQYVEFMEALQVYTLLLTTNVQNLDVKSQELKRVLQVWRERLPNTWDDINMWNDLVTWRQHAFNVINKVYTPFIPMLQQLNLLGNANLYAYRGFHEIAWVINRFAHVARQHQMPEVCIKELSRIYQLPNIEIHEAFLKLKEQVKCHYHNSAELNTGLDVISNTNLVFFTTQQKAEFFTLKGMFLNKMGQKDEANKAFATLVQIDLNLPKAWAEWGTFNDRRFKEALDMVYANNAISCYLQAAGLYKNGKTRKLLARILWLILLDDALGTLARAFDDFRGEVPVWYWLTFIPQLLAALGYREAKLTRQVLVRIAKSYPQALHFQLRTTREDLATQARVRDDAPPPALEHVDEIMGILKTAYPLLALLLELIVDQINQRFKCTADEDAYRLGVALLNDGVQYLNRIGNPRDDAKLPPVTEANITRFAETVLPKQIRAEFEKDLVVGKPNLETYITKLRRWRDRLEDKLDRRVRTVSLENLCPHLVEFHHQKFEEIEVPGQYLLNRDNNTHFVKIERFLPTVDLARGTNACYKRLRIRGHDGTRHTFAVQFPAARHCRREECVFQLFRVFGDALDHLVETRRRHIAFTMPVAVPLLPHIRIVLDDPADVLLQKVYERWCRRQGKLRDAPFVYTIDKLRAAYDQRLPKPDMMLIRVEILAAIQLTLVPLTVLKHYFVDLYPQFEDFWLFRKQFTAQYALFVFTTYMMFVNARQPQKIHVLRGSGAVWTSDMLPCKIASKAKEAPKEDERPQPIFCNAELVPFRLTPNIQKLIGDTLLEGVLAVYVLCIAQALADPDLDLETYLTLFVRDEVIAWFGQQEVPQGKPFRDIVKANVDYIIKRVMLMAHISLGPTVATQNVLELISQAVNPRNLAAADTLWMAYF